VNAATALAAGGVIAAGAAMEMNADASPADSAQGERTEGGERRERRSRDRYGRDRRERGSERGERSPQDIAQGEIFEQNQASPPATSQHIATESIANDVSVKAAEPVAAPRAFASSAPVAAVATPAASQGQAGMPKVGSFALPVAEMDTVASGAGLQWVNSNPERIAAVKAQIAAEPKPIHIPRERPPAVVIDAGPLVLVETKRDLRNMTLPFEQATQQQQ
jgi:ribonuclease E